MNPVLVILAALLAVGLGVVTAEAPQHERNRLRGEWRSASLRSATDGGSSGSADEGAVVDPDDESSGEEVGATDETEVPETPEIVREIDYVPLAIADSPRKLELTSFNELSVGYDNERAWHAGGKTADIESNSHLKKMVLQRNDRPFVIVAHKDATWYSVRDLIQQLERGAFVQDVWLGVGTEDEPEKLHLIPFPQSGSATLPLPEGPDVFRVTVEGEEGNDPVYKVNGETIAEFPVDLAMAFNEHKSRFSTFEQTLASHDDSMVVLDGDRDALYRYVVSAIEVLRNLGVEAIRIDHGKAMRRVR